MDLYQKFCNKLEDLAYSKSLLERAAECFPDNMCALKEDLQFIIDNLSNECASLDEILFKLENDISADGEDPDVYQYI